MAQGFLKPNIILLKDGTDTSQGKPQIISNINSCQAVVNIVKTTLGPRGMDKLIQEGSETTITNDGATVMKKLNIVHPAARILVDIAKAQDQEVGDGTTSVVVLAGELLKEAKNFLEDGLVAPQIIKGYRTSCNLVLQKLQDMAVDLSEKSEEEKRAMLIKCAETTLTSKLVADYKVFFSSMIVDAVKMLGDDLNISAVGIKKVTGGSVTDSLLVDGVAFKKTFSYAGFEQQPKRFTNPKILLLNLELELKAEKDNAEIRITDPSQYQSIVDAEWSIIYEKLDLIVNSGAQVVLSRLAIGDLATQYFADRNIFCAGRVDNGDLERTRRATGAEVQTTVQGVTPDVLGTCGEFEEMQIGAERYNLFTQCPQTKTSTIIIRGGAQQFIDEADRSLHDAIMIVRRAMVNRKVVGGGGAIEMELSRFLREYARTITGKQQLIINYYARALECIPITLAQNSGADSTQILNQLRQKHAAAGPEGRWYGVDCVNCTVVDTFANYIWEPFIVKESALAAATEAACLILSIDETVKNPQSEQPQGGGGGKGKGKGMGKGMGKGRGRGMRAFRR
jgi:T-complex protein 1 subunit eta|mmetsp:Transcript_115826/g.181023  ORF Transcript_115826/g.181023 Transcript_115826/m.181023 type:complete len:565 (+) Transcript_115826:51-1745(+)